MSTQWQTFNFLSLDIKAEKVSSAQWQVLQKFCSVRRNDSPLPPNSRFVGGASDWSVMSSITGPSLGSELPRTILPMEVIMVSRYTSPVVLSFTTRLELMLERLGFDTIPMDIVPTGVSWSTSTSSRFLSRQLPRQSHKVVWVALLMPVFWLAEEILVAMEPLGVWMVGQWKWSGKVGGPFSLPTVQLSVGGFPCGYHRSGWVYYYVPPGILWGHLWYGWCLWSGSGTRASAVAVAGAEGLLPSSLGRSTPWKTSSSVKER